MAETGPSSQNYNNELLKCLTELKQKRDTVHEEMICEEREKSRIQKQLVELTKQLHRLNESIAHKQQSKNEYDKIIQETEAAYMKILESSQTLLHVLKRGKYSIEQQHLNQETNNEIEDKDGGNIQIKIENEEENIHSNSNNNTFNTIWDKISKYNYVITPRDVNKDKTNMRWKAFETEFVENRVIEELHGNIEANYIEITCKLAIYTKSHRNENESPRAPWRSVRGVTNKYESIRKRLEKEEKKQNEIRKIKDENTSNDHKIETQKGKKGSLYSENEKRDLLQLIEETKPGANGRDSKYFNKIQKKHNEKGYNRTSKGLSAFWYRFNIKKQKNKAIKRKSNRKRRNIYDDDEGEYLPKHKKTKVSKIQNNE